LYFQKIEAHHKKQSISGKPVKWKRHFSGLSVCSALIALKNQIYLSEIERYQFKKEINISLIFYCKSCLFNTTFDLILIGGVILINFYGAGI